jgi:hypothetical protein
MVRVYVCIGSPTAYPIITFAALTPNYIIFKMLKFSSNIFLV